MSRLYSRNAPRTRASLRTRILIGAAAGFMAAASLAVFVVMQSDDDTPAQMPRTFTKTFPALTFKKIIALSDGFHMATDGSNFCKFDSNGVALWCVNVIPPLPVLVQALVETTDGGLVAVCQTTGNTVSKIYLVKLSQQGTFVWARTLEKSQSEFAYGAAATADNGLVLCGSGCNTVNYLLKLNQNGDQVWLRDYTLPGVALTAQKVMGLPDGGFVMAGRHLQNGNHSIYLARTDAQGIVQYARMFGVPQQPLIKALKPAPDGGYVMAGQFINSSTNPFVMKVDGTGHAQWFKAVGGNATGSINDVAIGYDNAVMCIGNVLVNELENVNLLLCKLDPAGQLLWHTSVGSESLNGAGYDDGLSIAAMANNHFMLAGYANGGIVAVTDGGGNGFCHYTATAVSTQSIPIQMQALSFGTVTSDPFTVSMLSLGLAAVNPPVPAVCYGNLNTVITGNGGAANTAGDPAPADALLPILAMHVYPNPTQGRITITVMESPGNAVLLVTDLSGRVLHSEPVQKGKGSVDLNLEFLPNGSYLAYLKTETRVLASGRFVIKQ